MRIWAREEASTGGYVCKATIAEDAPVTAVDFMNVCLPDGHTYLAVGTEAGRVRVYNVDVKKAFLVTELEVEYRRSALFLPSSKAILTPQSIYPYSSKAVTQLGWKPISRGKTEKIEMDLAIASEDSSLRVYSIDLPSSK